MAQKQTKEKSQQKREKPVPEESTFSMKIEDKFFIKNRGPVVIGKVQRGVLQVGDNVEIITLQGRQKAIVEGIEKFRKHTDIITIGESAGIMLKSEQLTKDFFKNHVKIGDLLCSSTDKTDIPGEVSEEAPVREEDIKNMEDKDDLKGLILALKLRDEKLREAAAQALCRIGNEQAIEPLKEALLKDDSWLVRRYAAEALGNIGCPQVVGPLTTSLISDPYVCDVTGRAVVRIVAKEALTKIEKALTATEPLDRLLACQWNSPIPPIEVTALIENLTRNCESISNRAVSKCLDAIEKLAKEKDAVVAEVMCYAALSANHFEVRDSAAAALKEIIKSELTQILCDALHYDREIYRPVDRALDALKIIGESSALSTIVGFLNDFRKTWGMKSDTAVIGMDTAVTLGAHLDNEKSICLSACRSLAALGGPEEVSAVEAVLSDSYWSKYDEIQEELPKLIAQMKR